MKVVKLIRHAEVPPIVGVVDDVLRLEDNTADYAIENGYAVPFVPTPDLPPVGYDRETGEIVHEEPAPAPAVGQPKEGEPEQDSDELKKPYGNRPKSEWAAYAVSKGANPETVEEMTKNELMAEYGERL